MGRNLNQIIAELSPERQERIEARYQELRQEVEGLRELRLIAGKAQADIATALKIKQPSVSKIEKQADMDPIDPAELRGSDRRRIATGGNAAATSDHAASPPRRSPRTRAAARHSQNSVAPSSCGFLLRLLSAIRSASSMPAGTNPPPELPARYGRPDRAGDLGKVRASRIWLLQQAVALKLRDRLIVGFRPR